jgi:hypothetical protein
MYHLANSIFLPQELTIYLINEDLDCTKDNILKITIAYMLVKDKTEGIKTTKETLPYDGDNT